MYRVYTVKNRSLKFDEVVAKYVPIKMFVKKKKKTISFLKVYVKLTKIFRRF